MNKEAQSIIRTVDAVVTDGRRVALIKRSKPPFMDKLVLPGGHVEEGEDFETAMFRELEEEVGYGVSMLRGSDFLTILDAPNRDPRPGVRHSVVFMVQVNEEDLEHLTAGSDAQQVLLRKLDGILPEEIGFDHYVAIEAARRRIK